MAFVHAKVEIAETAATIAAEGRFVERAVEALKATRSEIERQVRKDPFFLTTMEPYTPQDPGPVVRRMCDASAVAGVGPMATVAGAVAQVALEAMVEQGCDHGWVDNGGDVALVLSAPATMEVFHEPGAKTAFGLGLEPTHGIIGVCTSSGRLGHSISLGDSDVALAVADSAFLADALATAIGNRVHGPSTLGTCFDPFKGTKGMIGALAMADGEVAMHGRLPELVEVEHSQERLTVHSKMPPRCYSESSARAQGVGT
jgi:ApbE superfamily uncharacterized protein (UPF0280 family)